ncbi:MAG: sensor histidine kinase [Pseudomonas sp.]
MRSIQRRLSLGLIGVLLVVGLLLAQASLWLFDLGLRRYLESALREEAESLLIALVRGPRGMQLDEQRLAPGYQRPFSGHYFRIDFAEQTWRSRSSWDRELSQPQAVGLQAELGDGPRAQQLLIYRADYRRFGHELSISVAQDYTPVLDSFKRMQRLGLGFGLGSVLLILLLQRWAVRRALRPLEEMRLQIAQLQQGLRGELDSRVPEELEPLVAQINHLLGHTDASLKRSRHALGNLGHGLKTPLAVLVSLADRAELSPALRNSLQQQLAQIEQRLSRELGRARLAGEALPGAHFDCGQELPGLFATLQMVHDADLALSWEAAAGLRLPWDREDLLELLGNLLGNACKWADVQVRLSIVQAPGCYRLQVDDDGPGIAVHVRQDVLGRGRRLDEQVAGHGLGLAIVCDIVEAWSGDLQLLDSPLGGLRVSVELPVRAIGR